MNEKDPHYKGMTTEQASLKKISGHINEHDYAAIINGDVIRHTGTDKADVADSSHRLHSVKSGKKCQIFLYAKSRLETNTIMRGMGDVASKMIACIDALPLTREEREANKDRAKEMLKNPMRELAQEIIDSDILHAFMMKAFFEGNRVDYLSILPSDMDQTKIPKEEKHFHVFDAGEAIDALCLNLEVRNSKRRGKGQTDDQKVVFWDGVNVLEIEIRTDKSHYRRIKMWMNSDRVLAVLRERISFEGQPSSQISVYGKAKRFKLR